jgi:hypothetical protein
MKNSRFGKIAVFALALLMVAGGLQAKGPMSTPTIRCGAVAPTSINVLFCAGSPTGAPAGFSLQWLTIDQFAAGLDGIAGTADDNTWRDSSDPSMCSGSFSGNANGSRYNLAKGECASVQAGDNLFDDPGASSNCADTPLLCGTTYVFRTFSHANSTFNRSAFTATLVCTTSACEQDNGCTFTQGFWKNHAEDWPVTSLTLGTVTYSQADLLAIFNKPAAGNGLISLAHQLIAAKLNLAGGADDSSIAGAIAAADTLIGGLVVPPTGSGSLPNSATSGLTSTLDSFNQGIIGPGHCPS